MTDLKGYLADVPELWFKRDDGKVFHFNEVTKARINDVAKLQPIFSGWNQYPAEFMPMTRSIQMTVDTPQFGRDLMMIRHPEDGVTGSVTLGEETVEDSAYVVTYGEEHVVYGELLVKWPVYTNTDNGDSAITCHMLIHIYRCAVISTPRLAGSYKSVMSNSYTFSAIEPDRDDGAAYAIAFCAAE